MPGTIIAFAGKGGVGKTTLASLVLRRLVGMGRKPVLAVDADPNATLALSLGIDPGRTIADLRDDLRAAANNVSDIPKDRLMDQWLAELLNEQAGFDLLTMGRPEGPQCYCYVNGMLRRYLSLLRTSYDVILVDCEAGMEYLSRLVVDDIETLILVAEDTMTGLATVERIAKLSASLGLRVKRRLLAMNKIGQFRSASGRPESRVAPDGTEATVRVPYDADLAERCHQGLYIDETAGQGARAAIDELASRCLGLPVTCLGTAI